MEIPMLPGKFFIECEKTRLRFRLRALLQMLERVELEDAGPDPEHATGCERREDVGDGLGGDR